MYCYRIGDCVDRELVGGKGSSLSIMKRMGLNVPPGVTLTTDAFRAWKAGKISIEQLYRKHVAPLLKLEVPRLGRGQSVSVRSGAASSMPGMMETVLNLGARDERHKLAYVMSYIKAAGERLDEANDVIDAALLKHGTFLLEKIDSPELMVRLTDIAGVGVQGTARSNLLSAIELVFKSWDNPKAVDYRQRIGVAEDKGTACTIQLMVDGLKGFSGVMLTRGDQYFNGPQIDWIPNAQGDSVVDGALPTLDAGVLSERYPDVFNELVEVAMSVEAQYHDAMDIEFTYDGKELYILQARSMKRTPLDAMTIALNLWRDKIIDKPQVMAVPLADDEYDDVTCEAEPIGSGYPISGKLLMGRVHYYEGDPIESDHILLREITTTNDIAAMTQALATITTTGGPTCHAALVARELGLTAIIGTGDILLRNNADITITPDGNIYRGVVEMKVERKSRGIRQALAELQERLRNMEDKLPMPLDQPKESDEQH